MFVFIIIQIVFYSLFPLNLIFACFIKNKI